MPTMQPCKKEKGVLIRETLPSGRWLWFEGAGGTALQYMETKQCLSNIHVEISFLTHLKQEAFMSE